MERTAILDVVYLVVVVVFLFFIDFCLLSRGKSTTIEFVRGFCTAAAPVFAAAASAAASLLGWGLKSARTTHTNTHSDPKATHTIYKNTYVSMYHTQIYVCVCVCVCVCFVGPQLLLAFIFSQLNQSCSSRQLENTHKK